MTDIINLMKETLKISMRKRMENILKNVISGEIPTEFEVKMICSEAENEFMQEPNIPSVSSPVCIIGDIHGQFTDLIELLNLKGPPSDKNKYIFLGDYVDRGPSSIGVIITLFLYKILFPKSIYMIRGNHEQKQINRIYGFYNECYQNYGSEDVWNSINNTFGHLSIACVVDKKYMCVHGGISNRISISNLQRVDRFCSINDGDLFNDVIWSDPGNVSGCIPNQRGCGVMFGQDALKRFLMENNLDLIIRSHQLVLEGYRYDLDDLCLTVWSAPNYLNKAANPGTVLLIEPNKDFKFLYFRRPFRKIL